MWFCGVVLAAVWVVCYDMSVVGPFGVTDVWAGDGGGLGLQTVLQAAMRRRPAYPRTNPPICSCTDGFSNQGPSTVGSAPYSPSEAYEVYVVNYNHRYHVGC